LLRAVERDFPSIGFRLVEIERDADLEREREIASNEPEVSYRDGVRHVRRFAPVALDAMPAREYAVRERGFYLVAGGLGAVGRLVARELLTRHRARLLVVGKTAEDGLAQDAAEALCALRQLGDVAYAAVDISDARALRAATRGLALDGVFHLASLNLHAQIEGSRALEEILQDGALYVAFASVIGLCGGRNVIAHAAANAFRIAYGRELAARGRLRAYTLIYSAWEATGLSRGESPDLIRANGLAVLQPDQALASMRVALWRAPGEWIIGLDADHPAMRPWIDAPPARLPQQPTKDTRIAPRNETERQIAAVWRSVLRVPEPGIDDRFFVHGGNSIRAAQLLSGLRDRFGIDIPLSRLFERPTIAGLAEALRELEPVPGRVDSIARRRAEVEQMPPEEVLAMLASRTTRPRA
jgi:acyl carrier protein